MSRILFNFLISISPAGSSLYPPPRHKKGSSVCKFVFVMLSVV